MQLYSLSRKSALLMFFTIPAVCLSMGGCPPPQNGGNPVCGNGSTESGEQCDDGNTTAGDGCSATCQNETTNGVCGDETLDAGEECDDGNTTGGDGCSSTCQDEDTPPPDDDGDGVPNNADQCPGTNRGTEVDATGCPANSPNDPDNDGVLGTADTCPNTPAGAPVDENGCAANQRDTDGDGVTDNIDACANTPDTVDVDEQGCPVSTDPTDDDADGVPNDIDQCPDTAADAADVDPNGCAPSQRDSDGDGINDDVDQCVDQAGTAADNGCPPGGGGAVCGNGAPETGEQCDDGNTASGDGCSSTCQTESNPGIANDNCANPTATGEGTVVYSNVGATTDGPAEPVDCTFFNRNDIRSDLWYCYTATCTGQAVISLCGSGYDTKMAVYTGCACPDPENLSGRTRPIACSDDDCGSGVDNTQSRVAINAAAGQSYMVRVGGYFGSDEQGEGRLTIRCGQDTCTNGTGSCTAAHEDNQPGCETASCCNRVCEVDTFCCDVTWDSFCASQAGGFCGTTGFSTCNAQAGACSADQPSPGCNNTECCNAICQSDPFCCITTWDSRCASQSDLICTTCGRGRGDCSAERAEPGCNDIPCCAKVCAQDEFCCNSQWDAQCVQQAADLCGR